MTPRRKTRGRASAWPPMRGEVWEIQLPRVGTHPAVILTVNGLIGRISEVNVAMITGTSGPPSTRIPLGKDAGLTRYAESYVDTTSVHSLPLATFTRRKGRLAPAELAAVEDGVRLVLGL